MYLINALDSLFKVEVAVKIAIEKIARRRIMPRGAILLPVGQINNEVHFLERGLVRAFYYDTKREITSWIANEGQFIWTIPSYLLRIPSRENIQLLEKSTLMTISRDDLDELKHKNHEVSNLQCQIMERYLLMHDQRIHILLIQKAEERLEAFNQAYPELYQRVPLRHIATFLGIDPSTLSRIRGSFKKY